MSSISSIETSLYSGLIENTSANNVRKNNSGTISLDNSNIESSKVDLSNYYSNIRPEDLLSQTGDNVVQSAEALDNAMVSAIKNGYGVYDACNIRLAEMAYKANCAVFDVAKEISTFELDC